MLIIRHHRWLVTCEIEAIKSMLDSYGIPLTISFVVGVLHIRLVLLTEKDREDCSAEIKMLNERLDQRNKEHELTIQQIRAGHDSDMNALLAMQFDARREWKESGEKEREEWKAAIEKITDRLMQYLESHNP